jgi:two-component system, NarL family, nitrate/nitrite response regulator NarL
VVSANPDKGAPHGVRVPTIRTVIVNDHTLFAEAVGAVLADRGYRVEGVLRTGKDAVEVARRTQPDLVLIDLRLPDGNGVDIGRTIAEQVPSAKVLAVTGGRDPDLVWRTMRAGFHGFVTKEASVSTLVESLDAVMAGRIVTPSGPPHPSSDYARTRARMEPLTPREREILQLLAQGQRTAQIATILYISKNTVRSHVQSLISKLGAHSRLEAVALARRRGLLLELGQPTNGVEGRRDNPASA